MAQVTSSIEAPRYLPVQSRPIAPLNVQRIGAMRD